MNFIKQQNFVAENQTSSCWMYKRYLCAEHIKVINFVIKGLKFNNKENYQKLIHILGKKQIKITNTSIFYKQHFFSNPASVSPSFFMNWASNVA